MQMGGSVKQGRKSRNQEVKVFLKDNDVRPAVSSIEQSITSGNTYIVAIVNCPLKINEVIAVC